MREVNIKLLSLRNLRTSAFSQPFALKYYFRHVKTNWTCYIGQHWTFKCTRYLFVNNHTFAPVPNNKNTSFAPPKPTSSLSSIKNRSYVFTSTDLILQIYLKKMNINKTRSHCDFLLACVSRSRLASVYQQTASWVVGRKREWKK